MTAPAFPAPSRGRTLKERRKRSLQHRRWRRHLGFEPLEDRRVLASIAGQLVYDFDGDGLPEQYEPGQPDWQIYIDENGNGQFDVSEPSALTDVNGEYLLDDLSPGFYTLRRVPQSGWKQTFPPEPGKITVNIRNFTQEITGINFAEQKLFTPFVSGNLVVTRSSFLDNDLLLEYTPAGQLVQAIVIPDTADESRLIAKDLVLDSRGNLQIYQGYDDVRLTTLTSATATFSQTLVPGWDMGSTFDEWGDIAAFGRYVFANEQIADGGTADGVIRFDLQDLSYERFSGGFGFVTDLTVGLDGLLYTLDATVNKTTILVHHPETMDLVRAFEIPQRLHSVAVDRDSNLYAITDTGLKHYTSDGVLVKSAPHVNGLDIAIDASGSTLVIPTDLWVTTIGTATVYDTDNQPAFNPSSAFPLPGSVAENFLAFAAFVREPLGEVPSVGIDYGVLTPGNILVSNSLESGGVPKLYEYTPFGELVQEYDLPLPLDNTGARDLATDASGNVQIYNGTFGPQLTTFDSKQGDFDPEGTQFDGWSSADVPTYGGLASYANYVFATDDKTQYDTTGEQGIVRYNLATGTAERFSSADGETIDLNVGQDGLLYTLSTPQTWPGNPSAITVTTGMDYNSLFEDDSELLDVRDARGTSGSLGFDLRFDFARVPVSPVWAFFRGRYQPADGAQSHNVKLQIYNYFTGRWDNVTTNAQDFPAATSEQLYRFELPSDLRDYGGNYSMRLRVYEQRTYDSPPSPQDDTHHLYLDQVQLVTLEPGAVGTSRPSGLAVVAGTAAFSGVGSLMADDAEVTVVPELRGLAGDPAFDFQIEFTDVPKSAGGWLDAVFRGWYSAPEGATSHDVTLQVYDTFASQWQDVTSASQGFLSSASEQEYVAELPFDDDALDAKPCGANPNRVNLTRYITGPVGGTGTLRLRVYGVRAYDSPAPLETPEMHQLHLDQVYLHSPCIAQPDLVPSQIMAVEVKDVSLLLADDSDVLDVRRLRGDTGDTSLDVRFEFTGVPNVPMQVSLTGSYEAHRSSAQEGELDDWGGNDANTARIVLHPGHSIPFGDVVDVWWRGGLRSGMTVVNVINNVINDVVTVDGGAGDPIPSGQPGEPMVVTHSEPHRSTSQEGTLTTRRTAESGDATVVLSFAVMAGDLVDVSWTGGVRTAMTVSKITSGAGVNTLAIHGGAGDPLPPKGTFLVLTRRNPGVLAAWTDANTGQVGLNPGHGIASGEIVNVSWAGGTRTTDEIDPDTDEPIVVSWPAGIRTAMTVGIVTSNVLVDTEYMDGLDLSGGSGDPLPPPGADMVVTRIASSDIILQIYNHTWSAWEAVTGNSEDIHSGTQEQTYVYDLPVDLTNYITGGDDGALKLRLYGARTYDSPGPPPPLIDDTDYLHLDYVRLQGLPDNILSHSVVRQYDPVSMELLKTVTLPVNQPRRAIAVDVNGDIFAADPDVYRYDNNGRPLGTTLYAGGIGALSDIDLDADGRLLVAANGGQILVTDRSFTSSLTFPTRATGGMNFAAFVSPDRPLPKARWDAFTVVQASAGNELEVIANDVPRDGTLAITGVGTPSQGGAVSIVPKTYSVYLSRLTSGTLTAGILDSLANDDGDLYTIAPSARSPGLDVEFVFQDTLDQLLDLRVRGYYQATFGSDVKLQLWNYDASRWDNLTSFESELPPAASEQSYRWRLPSGDYRDVSGERRVRLLQTWPGGETDRLYLDQVVLEGQTLRYTPAKATLRRPDFVGTETFTYTVSRISPVGDVQLNSGTFTGGNAGSLLANDDNPLTIAETAVIPGLGVEFVFQDTPGEALDLRILGRYEAALGRGVKIQIWNYDTSQWDNLTSAPSDIWHAVSEQSYRWPLPAGEYRDSDGQRRVKIVQPLFGNAAYHLVLDALFLEGEEDEAMVQVTVAGNGNFFTVDESYTSFVTDTGKYWIQEDGIPTPTVPAREGVLINDGRPDIFPVLTPGNILVVHSPMGDGAVPLLQEYTPDGTLQCKGVPDPVTGLCPDEGRSVPLPSYSGETGDVGDVVLDRQGNVQVYNGTDNPRLTTYDAVQETLTHTSFTNWNTATDKLGGGLAAWRNFVYATDQAVMGEDPLLYAGIVRFDIEAGTAVPFVRGVNLSDVAVGLDGFLYALGTSSDGKSRFIRVYDPLYYDPLAGARQLREIRNLPLETRAITVGQDGTIYAVRYYPGYDPAADPDTNPCLYDSRDNPYVYEYNPNGTLRYIWDIFGIGDRKPPTTSACGAWWEPTGLWDPNPPQGNADDRWIAAEEYSSESDFSDIDLSVDGSYLLIANINQSNSLRERIKDIVVFHIPEARIPPGYPPVVTAKTWDAPDENSDMKYAAWVQAPVGTVNGPLVVSSYTQPSHGSFDCNPLDPKLDGVDSEGSFCYTPDPDYSGRDGYFYVVSDKDGKHRGGSVTLTVAPQNDPPVLTAVGPRVTLDHDYVLTVPLTALINGGLGTETNADENPNDGLCTYRRGHAVFQCGTTAITDADWTDPLGGIAVTELTGPGVWSFSLNGKTFVEFGTVSPTNALLLPASADVRFTPSIGMGGTATFQYVAWDQSTGTAGSRTSVTYQQCVAGGVPDVITGLCQDGKLPAQGTYGAYSQDEDQQPVMDTWTVTLSDLNDAPVLVAMNPYIGTTDEDQTSGAAAIGDFVTQAFDPDGSSWLQGIVLTGATGNGFWEYSLDGSTYYPLPSVTSKQALILEPDAHLRYTPDNRNGEVATVTYRAWDTTNGVLAGEWVDASQFGGLTAYSEVADTGLLVVNDLNDAPVLTPQSPVIGQTDVMTPITVVLDRFVQGITDVDRGAVTGGIAITGTSGQGTWFYSLNGTTFVQVPPLSTTSALLLRGTDAIRYQPAGGSPETATIAYRAWDATQGAPGDTADVTNGGGETAFGVDTDSASLTVKEVNDPPVISGFVSPANYTENGPPAPIVGGATVFDPDSADFAGGRLEVAITSGGTASDRLLIREGNGISLAGDTVIYDSGGPRLIGSLTIDGWLLTVHFTTLDATQEAAQALLRSVAYENVSDNPSTDKRRIQISLSDGDGGHQTRTVTQTVTVQPVNDPPLAEPDAYSTVSGQKLVLSRSQGVLANDRDPEGTAFFARLVEAPPAGDLTLNADGSFTYQPDPLSFGQDYFWYEAWDGQAASAPVRVSIEVRPKPTNPAHPADVNADGFLSPLDAVLIANYLLRSGAGPLPAQYAAPPFVDYNGDGSVTQTDVDRTAADIDNGGARPVPPPRLVIPQTLPSLGAEKLARVTLEITDAAGTPISSINAGQTFYLEAWVSDQRTVPLGLAAAYLDVSYPSSLVSVSGAISTGAEFPHFAAGQTSAPGLIDEAGAGRTTTLPDGQKHRLWRIPMLGLARGDAVFTADPADNLPAGQILLFGVDGPLDGFVNVEYQDATIQIKGPAVAENDVYDVGEDRELTVTDDKGVLANDDDEEGDPLTAVLVDAPSHGALQFSETGAFTYKAAPNFFGTDRFTYRANDGFFDSNLATVAITITSINDAPVAAPDSYSVLRNQSLSVPAVNGVLANDRDVEGDPLTVQLVQSPLHGDLTLRTDGSFDYTPTAGYGGPDGFTYKAADGNAESSETVVHLDVSFGWQNPFHPVDINGDGYASPIDALLSFNDFAIHGVRILPDPPVQPDVPPPFLDFNGDNLSSDFDGKKVLADLNANGSRLLPEPRLELPQTPPQLDGGTLVRLRLEAVNAQGHAVSTVNQGETFFLNVYAADLRPAGTGVFSAYLDVAYDQAALAAAGVIQFGAAFPNVRAGGTATPGLLDEAGGVRPAAPDGVREALLLKVSLTATGTGSVTIAAGPADVLPAGQVTLYGINGPIPPDKIEYGTAQVTVVRVDSDGDGVTDFEEAGSPHGGDGNQDGIADRLQKHVASLRRSANDPYVTIAAPPQVTLTDVSAVAAPAPGTGPSNVEFPLGFFRFDAGGIAAGGAATVIVYTEAGVVTNTCYGYGVTPDNAAPHWYPFLFDGVTGATVFADRIELRLADGQRGDADPTPSRLAFEAGGAGRSLTPWTNPGNSRDVSNDGSVTPADALTLINAINVSGPRTLPLVPEAGDALPSFRDTNGDNLLEAVDVLNIVNFLNTTAAGEGEWTAPNGPALGPGLPDAASRITLGTAAGPPLTLLTERGSPLERAVSVHRLSPDTPDQAAALMRARTGLGVASGLQPGKKSGHLPADAMDFDQTLDEIAHDVAQTWGFA